MTVARKLLKMLLPPLNNLPLLPGHRLLMYPQAETKEGRLDSLDPDNFRYEITSREIPPAAG